MQLELDGLESDPPPSSPPAPLLDEPTPYDETPPLITPGVTLCYRCRRRDAELVMDADTRHASAVCFDCLELVIERENAIRIAGAEFIALLPRD